MNIYDQVSLGILVWMIMAGIIGILIMLYVIVGYKNMIKEQKNTKHELR